MFGTGQRPRVRIHVPQPVPAEIDQVRGHHLARRFAFLEPPRAGQRHHADEHLRVHRGELGVDAALPELAGQDVLGLAGDVVEQRRERPARSSHRRVAGQDAKPVRLLLDVGEQRERGLFDELVRLAGRQCVGEPVEQVAHLAVDDHRVQAFLAAEVLVDHRLADARARRDLLDGGGIEALFGEQRPADEHELLAAFAAGHSHARTAVRRGNLLGHRGTGLWARVGIAQDDSMTPPSDLRSEPLTYSSYLRLSELLSCQSPRTAEHDELLFVIIHQVYELWFKQILHETALLQRQLEAGQSAGALHSARRIAKILKTIVGQLDVLETMTPRQFAAFRPELGGSSGFQSEQFRELEAVLGRRDIDPSGHPGTAAALERRSVFDSLLRYLAGEGFDVPPPALERDPREPWRGGDPDILAVLTGAYADDAGAAAEVCESLVDIDEGIQEWRYRHVKMVERIIGAKVGTGGSAGAAYLRSTLFRPSFPDLWAVRGEPARA